MKKSAAGNSGINRKQSRENNSTENQGKMRKNQQNEKHGRSWERNLERSLEQKLRNRKNAVDETRWMDDEEAEPFSDRRMDAQDGETMRNHAEAVRNPHSRRAVPGKRRQPSYASKPAWQQKLDEYNARKRRLIMAAAGVLLCLLYAAAAFYYSRHFYKNTWIYGVNCGGMTVQQAKQKIREHLQEYSLTVTGREDYEETITADQIGLSFSDDGKTEECLNRQNYLLWPAEAFSGETRQGDVTVTLDQQMALLAVNSLECMDPAYMEAPQDAYLQLSDIGFSVASEVKGTTLDMEKTRQVLLEAMENGLRELSLEDAGCYVDPEILSDNEALVQEAEEKSRLCSANFVLDCGTGIQAVNVSIIQDWIVENEDGSFSIDTSEVSEFVRQLAASYDTFGVPVDFYTTKGTVVTLYGGDYGWCIDQDATTEAILEALEEGFRGTMEPVYLYEGMSHENNGIGYTYVEICISDQKMWCYENGYLVVETDVVTGNPNNGCATPSGAVWSVDAKERNATLVGEGYEEPVDYWIPFNGNIGIHDLKSRTAFGGDIYLYSGSHGCINTPYDAVQIIYDVVSVGTPVIVYD